MINHNFILLGAVICLAGGASYIIDTIKGRVKPNRISWGMWGIAVMVAFSAELRQGVGIFSLATFMVGFVPILIFFASFLNKDSYWKLTSFDFGCGILSLIGIILWIITKNPNLAILFSIIADFSAGIPTLIKSYLNPETENYYEYIGSATNVTIALLALNNYSFAYLAFPLYILFYDFTAFILIRFKISKLIAANS